MLRYKVVSYWRLWMATKKPRAGSCKMCTKLQRGEIGDKRPSGPSLKFLHLIARKGIEAVL